MYAEVYLYYLPCGLAVAPSKHGNVIDVAAMVFNEFFALNKQITETGTEATTCKCIIFNTQPAVKKVYKNSENRRKQDHSFGFRSIFCFQLASSLPFYSVNSAGGRSIRAVGPR